LKKKANQKKKADAVEGIGENKKFQKVAVVWVTGECKKMREKIGTCGGSWGKKRVIEVIGGD